MFTSEAPLVRRCHEFQIFVAALTNFVQGGPTAKLSTPTRGRPRRPRVAHWIQGNSMICTLRPCADAHPLSYFSPASRAIKSNFNLLRVLLSRGCDDMVCLIGGILFVLVYCRFCILAYLSRPVLPPPVHRTRALTQISYALPRLGFPRLFNEAQRLYALCTRRLRVFLFPCDSHLQPVSYPGLPCRFLVLLEPSSLPHIPDSSSSSFFFCSRFQSYRAIATVKLFNCRAVQRDSFSSNAARHQDHRRRLLPLAIRLATNVARNRVRDDHCL
ncbi:hypothetical protein C8R43DRAFT_1018998 [Mycena crocata]|nr:hypothetical protein C8R43DRAFT_1018998 [Mycena crocata]